MQQTSMKFKLTSATPSHEGEVDLVFDPDYADDRNKEWSKYTPGAQLKATVLAEVAERLEVGAPYDILIRRGE